VFRDPYFLDFLGLSGQHIEKDVEDAILRELQAFILELGSDFAFVARQKRITIDSEDYYIDYLTELPSKQILEKKLHQSIEIARERLARAGGLGGNQERLAEGTPSQKASEK